jgi:hypothetical protein
VIHRCGKVPYVRTSLLSFSHRLSQVHGEDKSGRRLRRRPDQRIKSSGRADRERSIGRQPEGMVVVPERLNPLAKENADETEWVLQGKIISARSEIQSCLQPDPG